MPKFFGIEPAAKIVNSNVLAPDSTPPISKLNIVPNKKKPRAKEQALLDLISSNLMRETDFEYDFSAHRKQLLAEAKR